MTSEASIQTLNRSHETLSIQERVEVAINELLSSFPEPGQISSDERRGMIARYAAVLEGNFIYWMTATYLSVGSEEARAKIIDNLREEIRDCHPGMMRRFAIAANALPTDSDARDVYKDMANVRLFVGRFPAVRIVLMMAFFEGFIQRFMGYLAELAAKQGSKEFEYTDVHGVCDVAHTEDLFRALRAEMALNPTECEGNLFEGVDLLRTLIRTIVFGPEANGGSNGRGRLAAS